MRPKSDAANDINKMASALLLLQTIRIRCATQKALRALFSVTESQRLQPGGQCHIAWDQGGVGWGGPAFDTFSPGKAGSINKLCDEGASITMLVHVSPNQSRQRQ